MLSEDFLNNGELEFLRSQFITPSKNGAEMQQSIDNCISELSCIEYAIKVMPVLSDVLKVLVAEYIPVIFQKACIVQKMGSSYVP